jgi:uncharacterized damage-inducible protein DinB
MPTLTETVRTFSVYRIRKSFAQINNCLDRLTDAQILHRNAEHENSIANLLLHLSGNLRQWILHGIDDQPDVRIRDAEFGLSLALSVLEIRRRFNSALDEVTNVLANIPDDRFLVIVDPQPNNGSWPPMTILEVVMQVVGHFQEHTGQIVLLTKQLTHADLDLTIPRKR